MCTNLVALLRPAWRRLLGGQPHLGFEFTATDGGLIIALWVPGRVPPGLVERAVEAAWPGARTDTIPAVPPLAGRGVATGGELRLAVAELYPLKSEHKVDPLRPLLGALSGLGEGESACVQLLARPVTGRRLTRLGGRARRLGPPAHRRRGPGSRPGRPGREAPAARRRPPPPATPDASRPGRSRRGGWSRWAPPRGLVALGPTSGTGGAQSVPKAPADARRPVALSVTDARYHVHVVGATGSGKSTLLTNLALSDVDAGRGVVVIDPKDVDGPLGTLPANENGGAHAARRRRLALAS